MTNIFLQFPRVLRCTIGCGMVLTQVGGPILPPGGVTVVIGGMPAARGRDADRADRLMVGAWGDFR